MFDKSDFKKGSPNHGQPKKKAKGMTICTPYGKDSSDVNGGSAHERTGKTGGGTTNLGHSLSGTAAVQRSD